MNRLAISTLSTNSGIRHESIKIAMGILVVFAASQIAIPLQPVPITMQTVAVMLIGLLYSRRTALLSLTSYLLLGAMGLPVFQSFGAGFSYLSGPTLGYLIGFIASVGIMSTLREKLGLNSFWPILLNCLIGTIVVFFFGLTWLSYLMGFNKAITFGLLPFIIPGAVKAVLLSLSMRFICKN